jgi:hypothetical protein
VEHRKKSKMYVITDEEDWVIARALTIRLITLMLTELMLEDKAAGEKKSYTVKYMELN